jgi:hypothetical protein
MGFATVKGLPPVQASTHPWVSFEGSFSQSSDWADGVGRSPEEIEIGLAATGLGLVIKGTQQPVKVPAIPTGTGQLVSPPVSFRIIGTDTTGKKHLYVMTPRVLNADSNNEWHINSLNPSVNYANNAGPNPTGLTESAANLLYVSLGQLATTGAHGLARFATAAEGLLNATDRAVTPFGVYQAEYYITARTASNLPNDFKVGRSYCHSGAGNVDNPSANGCLIETIRMGGDGTWGDHQRAVDSGGDMWIRNQNGVTNAWGAWKKTTP